MSRLWLTAAVIALVAALAGATGVYVGLNVFANNRTSGSLDDVMHRELHLDETQDQQLREIEARYAQRKSVLETEMRAATRQIAEAVSEDKSLTPRVELAVEQFHRAMGSLQHDTIVHVFEMRAVLTPVQQARFDELVRRELLKAVDAPE